jgi:HEAT repeat protein
MLEALDRVDWASLQHAYGEATDVPGLLRDLLSADPMVREGAVYELFGNIWHQGTVYPATAAAVPFLYELLTTPDVPDKTSIAHLLASIADGKGGLEVHAKGEFGEPTWRRILAKAGKTLEGELAREAAEVGAVRREAAAGLRHLLLYLGDREPEIRRSVAAALGRYPEHADWALPAIEDALAVESDDDVREALAESQARLTRRRTGGPAK